MGTETLGILILLTVVFLGVSLILCVIVAVIHLVKGPQCPSCNDWLEVVYYRYGGPLYRCPGCHQEIWYDELEAHRERQSTRGG